MSGNSQTSDAGGGEATANGSGHGSEAPGTTGSPPVDDAADSSSQQSEADTVDDGIADSAPAPVTDPSAPSPNGARTLTALPVEILRLITAYLDPIAHHSVRGSCPTLHSHVDAPPLMSHGEYIQFHKQYEAHHRKRLPDLLCPFCNIFKGSTPSKRTFTDAQAVQNYSGKRSCIECGNASGHYDRRGLVIKKQKLFLCGGCKLILPLAKEDKSLANVVITKGYPYRDSGWGRGAEITVDSGGKRWCKTCRIVIGNLGDSGAMKLKQVYMP